MRSDPVGTGASNWAKQLDQEHEARRGALSHRRARRHADCMHARDAMGIPHANQFRLRSDCGDDAAAAYLLQNWMQHL